MKASNPLVIVGLSVGNEVSCIRKTLDSLLNQEYKNFEIIIDDNASIDGTSEICREYAEKDHRISYSRHDENAGAFFDFLSRRDEARGDYFLWTTGHDLWQPEFIARAVEALERHSEAVLCYSNVIRIDSNGHSGGFAEKPLDLRGLTADKRLISLVKCGTAVDILQGLIRLQSLKDIPLKNLSGQEYVLLAELALKGSFEFLPDQSVSCRKIQGIGVDIDNNALPLKGLRMPGPSEAEQWRTIGRGILASIERSGLSSESRSNLKNEVRECFQQRYGCRWNEVLPSELNPDGKNVLLVTSAPPQQTPFYTNEKRSPIGIGFLISVLRDAGHNVFFIDNYLSPSDFLETDYLQRHQIDVVGIYTNTICFRDSLRMIRTLDALRRNGAWQGRIVVGGPHASVSPQTIPACVDHVVIGEGEYALRDIVAGVVKERIVQYPPIKDLDALPMPAWDYFADMPYDWGGKWLPEGPVFTMNTSRGCPFDCTFCSVGSIWGRRYICFSPERIVADIEHLIAKYGARGIYFREDNFTLNKKRLEAFCTLMLEKGIDIPWVCETRASSLDEETVDLMARAGARGAYIGVESGSQRLLDFMHKDIKREDVHRAFRLCRERGINTAASMIVGVPGETEEDLRLSRELLEEIEPTVTWFNVFVGIPDSTLYRHVLENRLYQFIDDRGLVYLHGHDQQVDRYYGGDAQAKIPFDRSKESDTPRPKVSVLLSVHNGEAYLQSALESLFGQHGQHPGHPACGQGQPHGHLP